MLLFMWCLINYGNVSHLTNKNTNTNGVDTVLHDDEKRVIFDNFNELIINKLSEYNNVHIITLLIVLHINQ